ncbi:MAG: Dihydrolipoamide acetyltransferase component of pyruvate dehydrogenase complex [Dehalococcoidia bacterium]|nr:Dihydrolipoamide acetyltransferase component of pyruvate dehydrogenase complex [Dehalococcoidia bacterium]
MATRVVMPQMGYDMKEGTLVRWLKQEGEEVKRGEAIAEIETDKAVVEMEAYASGVLLRIAVAEGATVPVGHTIAVIGTPGEPLPEMGPASEAVARVEAPGEEARIPQPSSTAEQVKASPLARRMAQEKGINLSLLHGTGPGGRVTVDDVQAHEARMSEAAVAPLEKAERPPETVPLSRMRQAIARRTAQSKRDIPHFYVTAEVDMTLAMKVRQQLNETLGEKVHISVNDLIVKACALALAKYPTFNASFEEDHLRMNPEVNVGIAVAVEQGLMVVSLGECRGRSLVDISRTAKEVVERAQKGVMRAEEYTGSTFSISNMGMFDVDAFSAIIYPPHAAALAVGTVRQQPVVRDGQIAIARVMKATLSTDHRVADGAQAAQFLGEVKRLLESPASLLL